MKITHHKLFIIGSFLIAVLVITGCSSLPSMMGKQEPTQTGAPAPIQESENAITAEGRVVPKDSVELGFTTSGQIDKVFFKEGDQVNQGDILAQLSGAKQLEAVIAAAEYELFSAEQALKSLNDDLALAQNQALLELNKARQSVHDAERKVKSLGGTADQNDVDIANTQVVFAKNALDKAKDAYAPYAGLPEDNLTRARLQVELSNKQKEYDAAVRKYNSLTGSASNFDLDQSQTDLAIAQTQLKLAKEQYDLLQKGADPDAVDSVNARIDTAKAQLEAAKADLAKLDLVATIDGRIVTSSLTPGKTITPGQPVVELADFSEWDVDTDNLTEIDVVDVAVGQKVTIVPDALPDLKLDGEVIKISDTYEEKRGDITYTVRIKLNETDPRLRWGMTVVVDFLK